MENENIQEEITLNVRKIPTFLFLILEIATLGFYFFYWLWRILKDISNLDFEQKNNLDNQKIISIPIGIILLNIFLAIVLPEDKDIIFEFVNEISSFVLIVYFYVIAIVLVRKLEDYAEERYKTEIRHNILGLIFFHIYYVNFAINDFEFRTTKARLFQKNYGTNANL